MTALAASVILGLAVQCGQPVAAQTIVGLVRVESGGQPYAILDNSAHQSYAPETADDAVALVNKLLAAKHRNLDIGLMQINMANFSWLGLTVPTAFESCRSIQAGVQVLTSLSAYNTGSRTKGLANGYVTAVLDAVQEVNATQSPSATAAEPPPPPKKPPPDHLEDALHGDEE